MGDAEIRKVDDIKQERLYAAVKAILLTHIDPVVFRITKQDAEHLLTELQEYFEKT